MPRIDRAELSLRARAHDPPQVPAPCILDLAKTGDDRAAEECLSEQTLGSRARRVRIIRDYGMQDRREAPQYFPEVG